MGERTIQDLWQLQGLPLDLKIRMTKDRIRQWIQTYGEDGVYVSFSGGKDSTVLLDLVRQDWPNVRGCFIDTGLEYPEIRDFVRQHEGIDWVKPKMNFKAVIQKYGYPFISKEVAECVYGARKYLTSVMDQASLDRQTDRQSRYAYRLDKLCGSGSFAKANWGGRRQQVQKTSRPWSLCA